MIKAEYEKLAKKHKLPNYGDVNNELEISSLESEDFLLRQIRKKIAERIDEITEVLGSILQPSADSMADMHECRFFEDKDKGKVVDVYKRLMILRRQATEAGITHDEKDEAALVSGFFKQWPEMKKELLPFIKKMKSCWEHETEIEEKLEYFG